MSIYPMYTRKITHWFARRSFQNRIFLLILFTSTIVMLAMSWYLTDITEERLHYQVGQRALIQAMQISAMPELVEAVQKRDLARIKALIDPMRSFSDATYITVGDASGQRLYHVNPDEIGKSMEGGDSDEALINAKSYVSVRKGSLGSSLRGKSPIQDATGKVIGIVSVGYTIEQLENWLSLQISSLLIPMAIMLLLLLFCARRFSLHIKKQMLNMEPQQLSQLLIQQSVLFESVFEGLIAIDSDYKITAINQTARRLLNLSQPEPTLIGKRISSVISQEVFFYDAPALSHNEWISIVGNLLDNAYNASLRQPQGSKQIECLINSDGQEVIIEIADQGCGIDEALRDRIFERGVTSSASKDHGIGLWLVRSYVEQAGGSIVVENNIPFGTIFTLYIPLTRDEHHG